MLVDSNFNISTGSVKHMGVKAGESITDLRVEVARVSIAMFTKLLPCFCTILPSAVFGFREHSVEATHPYVRYMPFRVEAKSSNYLLYECT